MFKMYIIFKCGYDLKILVLEARAQLFDHRTFWKVVSFLNYKLRTFLCIFWLSLEIVIGFLPWMQILLICGMTS